MSAYGTQRTCKPRLMNVCFERKNGHDANVTRCRLMTQSGYADFGSAIEPTIGKNF